jgi:hypothetical protein
MEAADGDSARSQRRELTTDMLRYWELRRIIYNVALALVVIGHAVPHFPALMKQLNLDIVLGLFVLAIGTNIVYSAAYVVDWFVQQSDFRDLWRRSRWMLLVTGTTVGAIIAHFFSLSMFSHFPASN